MVNGLVNRILVIDSDLGFAALTRNVLSRNGYTVDVAYDKSTALKYIQNNVPDVVILDVSIIDTNGISLCQELRLNNETSTTPIIVFSIYDEPEMIHSYMQAGANLFASKSNSPFELVSSVEKIISRANTQSSTQCG